jgi:hypothetical protein
MSKRSPFPYVKTSPEIIRLAVMLYIRFPLSLRKLHPNCKSRHLMPRTVIACGTADRLHWAEID